MSLEERRERNDVRDVDWRKLRRDELRLRSTGPSEMVTDASGNVTTAVREAGRREPSGGATTRGTSGEGESSGGDRGRSVLSEREVTCT